jgi:hypothetical protein
LANRNPADSIASLVPRIKDRRAASKAPNNRNLLNVFILLSLFLSNLAVRLYRFFRGYLSPNYLSIFLNAIESATHVKPENIAKGSASANMYSGSKWENILLKSKKVENKAIKSNIPEEINESLLVIWLSSFQLYDSSGIP